MYHPGGIDFDGENVWVPAAEYRPDSKAIVYKVNPKTYRVTEQFRVRDHVGGVVRDRRTGLVHGVSWGSRTLYEWTASRKQLDARPNQSHLLDYQDCDYVARSKQLCGGVTGLPTATGGGYELGGLALIDLNDATGSCTRSRSRRSPRPGTARPATRWRWRSRARSSGCSPPRTTAKTPTGPSWYVYESPIS